MNKVIVCSVCSYGLRIFFDEQGRLKVGCGATKDDKFVIMDEDNCDRFKLWVGCK